MKPSGRNLKPGKPKPKPPPCQFMFVNSDGLNNTVNSDMRSHVSRQNRREARYRACQKHQVRFDFTWSRRQPASPSTSRTEKNLEGTSIPAAPAKLSELSASESPEDSVETPENNGPDWLDPIALVDENNSLMNLDDASNQWLGDASLDPFFTSKQQLALRGSKLAPSTTYSTHDKRAKPSQQDVFPDQEGHWSSATTDPEDDRFNQSIQQAVNSQQRILWSSIYSMPLDPFDSLPIRLNSIDQCNLLSFQTIPDTVYRVPSRTTINNHRDWGYPIIVRTPMLIHAAMAVVVQGREARLRVPPSNLSFAYKYSSIRTLNEWIHDPARRNRPEVMIGIAALAAGEHYRGWSGTFFLHVRAFNQVLRASGGWPSFKSDPKTGWFIFGQAIMFSQATVASLSPGEGTLLAHRASIDTDIRDLLAAKEDLLDLLSRWVLWARKPSSGILQDPKDRARYNNSLGDHTLLTTLLRNPDYLNSLVTRTAEVECSHQLFAIIYITLVKWEHRDRPAEFLAFLDHLHAQMRKHDVSRTNTTIPLVWLLIQGVDSCPERKERALELLKVLHKIDRDLRERLVDFMLGLLRLHPPATHASLSFEDLQILDADVLF